jgi:transposase-like protein
VIPESVIYTDSFRSYDGLVLDGFKRFRISQPPDRQSLSLPARPLA